MNDVPRQSGLLDVSGGHRIYWEEWGAADGVPALYLHGGPGGTLGKSGYRKRFDPSVTRIIGFDQRGCGRSRPHASLRSTSMEDQNMDLMLRDIEDLRVACGVERWILNGVSWGSTLALAYAMAHPDRVLGIVLLAVTTTSRSEVDWITEGVGDFFPDFSERFHSHAESAGIGYVRGGGRVVEAYSRLLNSDDPGVRDAASHEWALWEDVHVSIADDGVPRDPRWEDDGYRLAFARLTAHYWSHDGFLDPPILDGLHRIADIPVSLVHGRGDVSGPAATAWRLHQGLPESELFLVDGEGHGGPRMVEHWTRANHRMVQRHRE